MITDEEEEMIEDARMAASTEWEEGFVADLLKKKERWKSKFVLSEAQVAKLEQIKNGDRR